MACSAYSTIQFADIILSLSQRRRLFHSEADLQHELGWELKTLIPHTHLRMEKPIVDQFGRGALDILAIVDDRRYGIELKFVKGPLVYVESGEEFRLSQHAYDFAAYDCCKDLERLEYLVQDGQIDEGILIILSNHPGFWEKKHKKLTLLDEFGLRHGRTLTGTLQWSEYASSGTKAKREEPIQLMGTYEIVWQNYSDVKAKKGIFRWTIIHVKD